MVGVVIVLSPARVRACARSWRSGVPFVNIRSLAREHLWQQDERVDAGKRDCEEHAVTVTEQPVRRTRKAEQRAETMEQIYDAAEELFSIHGLHGVTLKDVAKQVGVHHTLLNYYFADKKALFDAVFARRAVVTSERRMRALDDYAAAAGDRPTVEGALHAFLDTDLDTYIEGGDGWRNYGKLGAQVANTPQWGAELMDAHFDPVVLRLVELLKQALPGCPEEDIFWGYHFVTGALMLTLARTGRIDKLSHGVCKSDDFVAVKDRMASFMAAGFEQICKRAD
jgi:AcrR family transcriptional regulator